MCGIAGHLRRGRPASEADITAQLRTMEHRGPDSLGSFVDGPAAIGQTRLAVIDLVTGDPPVTGEGRLVAVAQNGEIYNYRALREELAAAGHRFTTSGDTEVIAHLAEDREPTAVAQALEGMFAFAVWDTRRRRLVLGRDRFGKKPLHWWCDGETFVFGSELKAVLAHPSVPRRLADGAISSYLRYGYVPTPGTFYDGIASVPPGHVLVVGEDLQVEQSRYWRVPRQGIDVARADLGLDEAADLVRASLERAVADRMVADVPVGAFLSGGVDSAAVVGLMARISDRPVRTFTIGFDDGDGFDERIPARQIAERFGTEHTELVVHPEAVDLVERLVWHHDGAFGDSSAIPTWLLAEMTRRDVTVALSGDGGDELFAGYERFTAARWVPAFQHLPGPARAVVAAAARTASPKLGRFAGAAGRGLPDALREWVAYVGDDDAARLCPGVATVHAYDDRWAETAGMPTAERLLVVNMETYLLDDLLPKVDRMSMAHGLEVRSPLLDHRLAELAASLPARHKARGLHRKTVLRRAVADLLPADTLGRPKRGFGVPLARWFRDDLAAFVDARMGVPDARVRQHLDGRVVDQMIADHRNGSVDRSHELWTLLTLEVFLRQQGW